MDTESKVKYRVISVKHPSSGKKLLRPVVVERPIFSLSRAVDFALDHGYVRGQKYDITGTILGFLEAVKYLDQQGNSVVIEDWLRFHGELTGYVDEETRRLGDKNGYRMSITPLKKFQSKVSDYDFVNVSDLEGRLIVYDVTSDESKVKDVLIPGKEIRSTGRNLHYSAARGDSITASWVGADGAAQEISIVPTSASNWSVDLGCPAAIAALPVGTEVTFTFRIHVGSAADAPEQVARRTTHIG